MNGFGFETGWIKPAYLMVVLASPISADVMLQFHVDRPGARLHGMTITTVGTGSFVWREAADVGFSNSRRMVAGESALWSTVVSGGTGEAARFNGVYVPRNLRSGRSGEGAILTSTQNGGVWIHAMSGGSFPRAVQWVKRVGGESLMYLGQSQGSAIPVAGEQADFVGRSPLFVLLSLRDERQWGARLLRKPAFEFQAVPRETASVPEPSGAVWLVVCGVCIWGRLNRRLRRLPH